MLSEQLPRRISPAPTSLPHCLSCKAAGNDAFVPTLPLSFVKTNKQPVPVTDAGSSQELCMYSDNSWAHTYIAFDHWLCPNILQFLWLARVMSSFKTRSDKFNHNIYRQCATAAICPIGTSECLDTNCKYFAEKLQIDQILANVKQRAYYMGTQQRSGNTNYENRHLNDIFVSHNANVWGETKCSDKMHWQVLDDIVTDLNVHQMGPRLIFAISNSQMQKWPANCPLGRVLST